MVGIGDSTLFPNSKMAAAAQLGQSRFRSGEITTVGGSGSGAGAEATAFLARTSGLDATHTNAYTALINGLVTDVVWSKLDALYIFATKDAVTAALNLVSTSYNGTVNGAPTFTVDRGFTGVAGSSTIYFDTHFNAATAVTPKYAMNLAHMSVWSLSTGVYGNKAMGAQSGSDASYIITQNAGGNAYFPLNTQGPSVLTSTPAQNGHSVAVSPNNSQCKFYKNGVYKDFGSVIPSVMPNNNIYVFGYNNAGTPVGDGELIAMASIGSGLLDADVTAFYNRLRTYMTAVGVP